MALHVLGEYQKVLHPGPPAWFDIFQMMGTDGVTWEDSFVRVYYDDVTDTIKALRYGIGQTFTGVEELTSAAATLETVIQSGTLSAYKLCIGPNLVEFAQSKSFPWFTRVVTNNHFSCVQLVCDLQFVGTPIITPATVEGGLGRIQGTATSSNGTILFWPGPFVYPYGSYTFDFELTSGTHTIYAIDGIGCMTTLQITIPVAEVEQYTVKYWTEYFNEELEKTRIEILEKGYTGESSEVDAGKPPFTVSWGSAGDLKTEPIKASAGQINLISKQDYQFLEFYTNETQYFQVKIKRGGVDGPLLWWGYATPEFYSEPYLQPPYYVSLVCNDGLGDLKNIPFAHLISSFNYEELEPYQGRMTHLEVIKECLKKISNTLPIYTAIEIFEDDQEYLGVQGLLIHEFITAINEVYPSQLVEGVKYLFVVTGSAEIDIYYGDELIYNYDVSSVTDFINPGFDGALTPWASTDSQLFSTDWVFADNKAVLDLYFSKSDYLNQAYSFLAGQEYTINIEVEVIYTGSPATPAYIKAFIGTPEANEEVFVSDGITASFTSVLTTTFTPTSDRGAFYLYLDFPEPSQKSELVFNVSAIVPGNTVSFNLSLDGNTTSTYTFTAVDYLTTPGPNQFRIGPPGSEYIAARGNIEALLQGLPGFLTRYSLVGGGATPYSTVVRAVYVDNIYDFGTFTGSSGILFESQKAAVERFVSVKIDSIHIETEDPAPTETTFEYTPTINNNDISIEVLGSETTVRIYEGVRDVMSQIYVDPANYWQESAMSCFDVIKEQLKPYGARMYQANGAWFIVRFDLQNVEYLRNRYTSEGVYEFSEYFNPILNITSPKVSNTNIWVFENMKLEMNPGYRKQTGVQELGYVENLIPGGDFDLTEFTETGLKNFSYNAAQYTEPIFFEKVVIDNKGNYGLSYKNNFSKYDIFKAKQKIDYVINFLTYDFKASFPGVGEADTVYIDNSNNSFWLWNGSAYQQSFDETERLPYGVYDEDFVLVDSPDPAINGYYQVKANSSWTRFIYHYYLLVSANYVLVAGKLYKIDRVLDGLTTLMYISEVPDNDTNFDFTQSERYFINSNPLNLQFASGDKLLIKINKKYTQPSNKGAKLYLGIEVKLGDHYLYDDLIFRNFYNHLEIPLTHENNFGVVELLANIQADLIGDLTIKVWVYNHTFTDFINVDVVTGEVLEKEFYMPNLVIDYIYATYLPQGLEPPKTYSDTLHNSKKYNHIPDDIQLMHGDAPDILNRDKIYSYYLTLVSGELTDKWYRKGYSESKNLLKLLLESILSNNLKNNQLINGSLRYLVTLNDVVFDPNNPGRLFMMNYVQWDEMEHTASIELAEFKAAPPSQIAGFSYGFSLGFNA